MKKIFLLLFFAFSIVGYSKPTKSVNAAKNTVASVLVYKNGELLRSGLGVFVGMNGEMLSSYSLFVDADSAVTIDNKGIVRPVVRILGADDLYDCVRASVISDKKLRFLEISSHSSQVGDILYMVNYGKKKSGVIEEAVVSDVDTVGNSRYYYTLNIPAREKNVSAPLVDSDGKLLALVQPVNDGDTLCSYAVSASYVKSLSIKAGNYNSERFSRIGIRKALPDTESEALSCLLLQSFSSDSVAYKRMLDEFIIQYPESHQGHLYMAEYNAVRIGNHTLASSEWDKALMLASNKDEVYYHKANTIYANKLFTDSLSGGIYGMDSALAIIDKAIELNNQPIYLRLKGNILYTKRDFKGAFDCYSSLTSTNLCNAELYVLAANCKEYLGDSDAAVMLLDSAVATFGSVPISAMAPYILNRGLVKYRAGRFREAVLDYNIYANLLNGGVNANFYYLREQAEYSGKMYRQALADIEMALTMEPDNMTFLLEKGRVCYRVNLLDEAIKTLEAAMKIASDNPDVYYMLARCQVLKGDKASARKNFSESRKYGHPHAAASLEELENDVKK